MTMIAKTFFDNPDFVSCVRLLGELHRLIQQGRDEGPEGDELRDRMDAPGERLSREELEAAKGIAADFHSLAENRDVLPADAERAEERVRPVTRERESRRFAEALELASAMRRRVTTGASRRGSCHDLAGRQRTENRTNVFRGRRAT